MRGLRGFPAVPTLAEARKAAAKVKADAVAGTPQGAPSASETAAKVPTFAEATEKVIKIRRPTWSNWRHGAQWQYTLNFYAAPALGDLPVDG